MQLDSISLKNFRQFRGPHVLDFSSKKGKSINVLLGNNGFGKTTTYRAINWCLFKKEPRTHYKTAPTRLNFKTADNMKIGSTKSVSVIIKLKQKDENGKERLITIERIEYYKKINHSNEVRKEPAELKLLNSKSEIFVSYFNIKGLIELEDASAENYLRNNIINEDIKDFFFLDGEDIQKFVTKNSSSKIRDHLDILTGIADMQRVLKNLQNLKSKLMKKVPRSSSSGIEGIIYTKQIKLEKLKKEVKQKLNKLDLIQTDIDDYKKDRDDCKAAIDQSQATSLLMKDRDKIDMQINLLEDKLSEIEEGDRINILSNFSYITSHKILKNLDLVIQKKIDNDELPPPTLEHAEDVMNFVIDDNKLTVDDKIFGDIKWKRGSNAELFLEQIEKYNKDSVARRESQMAKMALKVKEFTVGALRTLPDNVMQSTKDSFKQRKDIEKKIENLNKERISLTEQIGKFDKNKFENVVRKLRMVEKLLKEKRFEYASYQNFVQQATKDIPLEEKDIAKLEKEADSSSLIHKQIQFIENSIALLEPNIENTRKKVVTTTSKRFQNLFNGATLKKDLFNVKITNNYNLEIKNQRNRNVINQISTGEQFLLGYSYMQAMQRGLQFKFPIVIDTPLAAIGKELRRSIMSYFIDLAKEVEGIQFTFLFTNAELTSDIQEILEPKIANFYEIEPNQYASKKGSIEDSYYKKIS